MTASISKKYELLHVFIARHFAAHCVFKVALTDQPKLTVTHRT